MDQTTRLFDTDSHGLLRIGAGFLFLLLSVFVRVDLCRKNRIVYSSGGRRFWIPAFAGMTGIRSYQPSALSFQPEKTRAIRIATASPTGLWTSTAFMGRIASLRTPRNDGIMRMPRYGGLVRVSMAHSMA